MRIKMRTSVGFIIRLYTSYGGLGSPSSLANFANPSYELVTPSRYADAAARKQLHYESHRRKRGR